MDKLILISSTQYPGYGGAATNAYALIKYLKQMNYNVVGIFFEYADVNVDPDGIGGIFRFDYQIFERKDTEMIAKCRAKIYEHTQREPEIMLCKNYRAPTYCKLLFPSSKNVYLISGISHFANFFPQLSSQEVLGKDMVIPNYYPEIESIEASDLMVSNSLISLELFHKIYPKYVEKIYPYFVDTTKEINKLIAEKNIPISEKTYDFIIAASILTRTDKNNEFLVDILKNPLMAKYKKIIIGSSNGKFRDIPNSTLLDMMPHKELMKYMEKSKILLYPSLNDANPNTVREAIHNKCIALISNNIGFYEVFPKYSVCETYDKTEWLNKSIYLIDNYEKLLDIYHINFNSGETIIEFINKFI